MCGAKQVAASNLVSELEYVQSANSILCAEFWAYIDKIYQYNQSAFCKFKKSCKRKHDDNVTLYLL